MSAPNQIVSLLDMLKLNATDSITSAYNFGMLAERFVVYAKHAEANNAPLLVCDARHVDTLCMCIAGVMKIAEDFSLPASLAQCQRSVEMIANFQNYGEHQKALEAQNGVHLGYMLTNLSTVFTDELRPLIFVSIPKQYKAFFELNASIYGEAVDNAFPDSVEDMEGAGKCLAFGQATATVFHLMRAMEAAVKIMTSSLGVTNVEKEWGKLLSDIDRAIQPMPKGSMRDEWSSAHTHLYHVKQAWRNSTMHPKRTYSETEAKSVFDAVGSFMRHLAPLVTAP